MYDEIEYYMNILKEIINEQEGYKKDSQDALNSNYRNDPNELRNDISNADRIINICNIFIEQLKNGIVSDKLKNFVKPYTGNAR